MTALPSWAAAIEPVDMDGAARVLGLCRRDLSTVIKKFPHYDRRGLRGTKKVFYPEHIAALREAIDQWLGSSSKPGTAGSGTPLAPSPDSVFDKALALATKAKPKNSKPNSKRNSGNVIHMASRRSGRSRTRP